MNHSLVLHPLLFMSSFDVVWVAGMHVSRQLDSASAGEPSDSTEPIARTEQSSFFRSYLIAATLLVTAAVLSAQLPRTPLVPFFVAVLMCGWFAGRSAALAVLLLGGAGVLFWFGAEGRDQFAAGILSWDTRLALYFLMGVLGLLLVDALRHWRGRAAQYVRQIIEQQDRLRQEISDRRGAERALDQQRHWLHSTLASLGDAVITTDTEGRVTFLNPVAAALTGWSLAEAPGQPLEGVFRSSAEEGVAGNHAVSRYLHQQGANGATRRTTLLARDGTRQPIEETWAPIRDETGRVLGASIVFRDVERRRRAEATVDQLNRDLNNRIEELQAILNLAPIGIAVAHDPECLTVTTNQTGAALLGLPAGSNRFGWAATSADRPFTILCNGRPVPMAELPLHQATTLGITVEGRELEVLRSNGSRLHVLESATPLYDDHGEIRGAIVAMVNMTDRKRAEVSLRQSEERYHSLVEATSAIVWTADAGRHFIERQPSWEKFTGQTWDQYQGGGWLEAVHPDDRSTVEAEWQQALDDRAIFSGESRLWHHATGRYHHSITRAVPLLNPDGRVREWIGALVDADEEKRIAAEIRAAKETAEVANRAKGEFLANVSHELRTPMYGIVGMTELALDEELSPAARDYLQTAKSSADVLLKLVNEILDFSKLESGKFVLETAPFRLRPLMDETIKGFSMAAAHKGLALACDVAAEVPDALLGDPLRLRQILMNLVNNAIKFSDQGEVLVKARLEKAAGGDVRLRFEVSDTGIGISDADQKRIFAPFTQIDSSSTRRHGGTGLGLTIATELARSMGGWIGVNSTPGRGSTFSFEVVLALDHWSDRALQNQPSLNVVDDRPPRQPPPETENEPSREKTSGHGGHPLRVLLAEDTLATQKIVKHILSKRGHAVEIARNGREVIEMIRYRRFDIVLMDVQMPIMDGLQATSAIRSLEAQLGQRVPIVALTAHAMQGDRERCLAAGMDAYLVKPVNTANLIELVERFSMSADGSNIPDDIASAQNESRPAAQADRRPFDLDAALARLGNDTSFFAKLVEFFLEDSPALVSQVRQGLEDRDLEAVARAAHSLKGLVGNFDAHAAARIAARLEQAGADRDLTLALASVESLQHEVAQLRSALEPYLDQGPAAAPRSPTGGEARQ